MSVKTRLFAILGFILLLGVIPTQMTAQADGEVGLPIEFSGTIQAINGTMLVVNDQTVDVSQITLPGPIRLGDLVGVRGQLLQDGRIVATSLVLLSSSAQLTPVPTTIPLPTPQPGSQGLCPRMASFWATPDADWPVATLMLGVQSYERAELVALLNDGTSGDASVRLARQLVAAKLNIAEGSTTAPIGSVILQADALLGQLNGRLPYGILPTAALGPGMVTSAELLDSYNRGLTTPYCRPADSGGDDDEAESRPIIIEGPVESVNGNIVRIYNFNVLVQPDSAILRQLSAGDIIRVDGTLEARSDVIVLVATTVVIVFDADAPSGDDSSGSRDDGSGRCENAPPDHAQANGWRWQCENGPRPGNGNGRGNGNGNGNGNGRGNGGDDGSGS